MFGRNALRLVAWAGIAFAAACSPQPLQPNAEDILAARQAALAFEARMRMEIVQRLEREEDPVAIYLAYRDNVPGWAKEIGGKLGVEMSRTALRVRNPTNAPDDWETRQMELFEFSREAGLDPGTMEVAEIVEENGAKVFRWIRPVVMEEGCITCHGEEIDPRLVTLINQEYPLDEAIDYHETELGGAYSVSKALTPPAGGK
jgi:hypothetical protein